MESRMKESYGGKMGSGLEFLVFAAGLRGGAIRDATRVLSRFVDEAAGAKRLHQAGVDAITTNRPGRLRATLPPTCLP